VTTKNFKKTAKQKEQVRMLGGPATHCLSYGGSRSAKTFGICRALAIRAAKTKSRHLATRLKFNHCKTSLFMDTFPKVFNLCFPDLPIEENRSDWYYKFPNGSEIWCGGLDEKKRVEKILGKEYSTIFFNEVSQIPYTSVTMALTRLAEKNDLTNKAYYDCNPPGKKQWVYPMFIKGLDPVTYDPLDEPHDYAHIRMNPRDNLENIDENYIKLLERLPEKDRLRFLEGEFTDDAEGNIYYNFSRERHVKPLKRKPGLQIYLGMDFNVDYMGTVICQMEGDKLFVIDEIHPAKDTPETARLINERYPGKWTVIPDSTGRNRKSTDSSKSDHQILRDYGLNVPHVQNPFRMDRYNCVNNLFEKDRLFIDPKCKKLIRDLESIAFKEGTSLPDVRDKSLGHITDALGYLAHWAFPIVQFDAEISELPR
jgi:PBSX family phage terminase large subunit